MAKTHQQSTESTSLSKGASEAGPAPGGPMTAWPHPAAGGFSVQAKAMSPRAGAADVQLQADSGAAGGGPVPAVFSGPMDGVLQLDEDNPMDTVGGQDQAFKPKKEFVVEILKTKVPPELNPGDIPDTGILRRHDPFPPYIDPWCVAFGFWRFQQAMFWDCMAQLKHHETNEGIPADPAKAIGLKEDADGEWLAAEEQSSKDLDNMKDNADPALLAAMSGQDAVTGALLAFTAAHQKMNASIDGMKGAKADMEVYVNTLRKESAEGEKAKVEAAIKSMKDGLKMSITLGMSMVTALNDPVTKAKEAGPGLVDKALDGALGWFARKAYEPDLKRIEAKLSDAKREIAENTRESFTAKLAQAQLDLEATKTELAAAAIKLKDALENKKNFYKAAGVQVDKKMTGDSGNVTTRNEAIMKMASLVRQARATGDAAVESLDNAAILNFITITNKEGLGVYGKSPTEGDSGQENMAVSITAVKSFANWWLKYAPQLIHMSDGWKTAIAAMGFPDDIY